MSRPRFWPYWFYRLYVIICYFGPYGMLAASVILVDRDDTTVFIAKLVVSTLVLAGHEIIWRFFVVEHCLQQSCRYGTAFTINLIPFRQCGRQSVNLLYAWGIIYYLGTYFIGKFFIFAFDDSLAKSIILRLQVFNGLFFACGLVAVVILLMIWGCLYLSHLRQRDELVLYKIYNVGEHNEYTNLEYDQIGDIQKELYRNRARLD